MTAPLDLAALRALYEAATRGEWKLDVNDYPPCEYAVIADAGDGSTVDVAACEPKGQRSPDAAFIVAAHNHWLELLAMAARLEKAEAQFAIAVRFIEMSATGGNRWTLDTLAAIAAVKP